MPQLSASSLICATPSSMNVNLGISHVNSDFLCAHIRSPRKQCRSHSVELVVVTQFSLSFDVNLENV